MTTEKFKAMVVSEHENNTYSREIVDKEISSLPEGNVASPELSTTVYPFILRGISLLGVDSVQCPRELRLKLWNLLSNEWKPDNLALKVQEVCLKDLDTKIQRILEGKLIGRTIVNLNL